MKSADLGNGNHRTQVRRLHGPRLGRILVQPEVGAGLMIIGRKRFQVATQTGLVVDDQVVKAFAAYRANHTFHVGSLPRSPRCQKHLFDAHILNLLGEVVAEDPVAISEQVARRSVPREGVTELLRRSFCRRMGRGIEMEDPTAVVSEHQEHVQDLETDGWHREEINGYQTLEMVIEEGSPGLRGRLPLVYQVLAHARLADVDAELE